MKKGNGKKLKDQSLSKSKLFAVLFRPKPVILVL